MTPTRLLLSLAAVLLAVPASAQAPASAEVRTDSTAARAEAEAPIGEPGPTVTVPLPNGPGVLYYRAGSVGVSSVRPRPGRRAPAPAPPPSAAAMGAPAADVEAAREALGLPPSAQPRAASVVEGVSRLDLLLLERDLLDAIDRRLARLAPGAAPLPPAPGGQTIIVPGQPVAPTVDVPVRPETGAPIAPPVVGPAVPRPAPGPVTVETVERAILETGLFRTTTVNFEFAKAALLPTSAATLDVLADVLVRYPALRVEVGGHTDDRGSDATNDVLSQRRAQSVLAYLVASGVASDRLTAVGYGERRPVAANENETGRALNRRVEFVVLNPEAATRVGPPEAPRVRDVIREELERLRRDG